MSYFRGGGAEEWIFLGGRGRGYSEEVEEGLFPGWWKKAESGLREFSCLIFQLFRGNFDRYSLVEQPIDPPVNGHYVQFNPRSWHGHISMRVEVYGCRAGERGNINSIIV